jgi:hypothetical protein
MRLAAEEPLPYGPLRSCQFLLLILILLMISPECADWQEDHEQDQDQEQEGRNPALPPPALCGITKHP